MSNVSRYPSVVLIFILYWINMSVCAKNHVLNTNVGSRIYRFYWNTILTWGAAVHRACSTAQLPVTMGSLQLCLCTVILALSLTSSSASAGRDSKDANEASDLPIGQSGSDFSGPTTAWPESTSAWPEPTTGWPETTQGCVNSGDYCDNNQICCDSGDACMNGWCHSRPTTGPPTYPTDPPTYPISTSMAAWLSGLGR